MAIGRRRGNVRRLGRGRSPPDSRLRRTPTGAGGLAGREAARAFFQGLLAELEPRRCGATARSPRIDEALVARDKPTNLQLPSSIAFAAKSC